MPFKLLMNPFSFLLIALTVLGFFLPKQSFGQIYAEESNAGKVLTPSLSYAYQLPGGDLADRYGPNANLGLSMDYIGGNNLLFGIMTNMGFGTEVKEDILAPLRTTEGNLIGNDRTFANLQLRSRNWFVGGHFGKLFPLINGKRSGIRATLGMGIFQHKILIQDDPDRKVTQLIGEYKKGYDRLSNGMAIREFIGYQVLSQNRRINFYAGFEMTQAFTQNRRGYNYDQRGFDTTERLDLVWGFRVGWILPFYLGDGDDIFY